MATDTINPSLTFRRRVSFNNISPDYISEDILPRTNHVSGGGSGEILFRNPNYNNGILNEILKLENGDKIFSKGNRQHTISEFSHNKRPKLPVAPSKSILKNKLSESELEQNRAMLDRGDIVDNGSEYLASALADDDSSPPAPSSEGRRTSLANLTDEELLAMDPQFNYSKSRFTNMHDLNFNCHSKVFIQDGGRRLSNQAISYNTRSIYASSNENNYRAISLTVRHNEYDRATEYGRTLLAIISGRHHTWNALDWLLLTNDKDQEPFLTDGDHLVVASLIPEKILKSKEKPATIEKMFYKKCESLLNYLVASLPKEDLKVKVTVEFVSDNKISSSNNKVGYKHMIPHIFEQYQPNLVIIGNKSTNLNFKYNVKGIRYIENKSETLEGKSRNLNNRSSLSGQGLGAAIPSGLPPGISTGLATSLSVPKTSGMFTQKPQDEFTIKLGSYITKYSSVPVIFVGNATVFHKPSPNQRKISVVSMNSCGSIESGGKSSTNGSTSPHQDSEKNKPLKDKLVEIAETGKKSRFQEMLEAVSDFATEEAGDFMAEFKRENSNTSGSLKFDESGAVNSKLYSIYMSQTSGSGNGASKVYKVKSLVSYDEDIDKKPKPKLKRISSSGNTSMSSKSNSSKSSKVSLPPKIVIESDSGSQTEHKKSIWSKFKFKKR